MTKFSDLKLDPKVLQAIAEAGYETPTPIQAGAIPPALEGRDVLGIAQTGTGKTASFTLPMITMLGRGRARARMPRSLVLCPTRELAAQVAENFDTYAKHTKLTKALLIGGVSFGEQDKLIDRGVDVLIATPGRLLDHFERGKLLLTGVQIMVVDEADRMLDMGFIPDIERIFQMTPFTRQTLFFSATMAPEIERITDTFLHAPERIEVARQATTSETITQRLIEMTPSRRDMAAKQKRDLLRSLIAAEGDALTNAIIFCNRKTDVDIVAKSLKKHGLDAAPIHGDLDQSTRTRTLEGFRDGKLRLLIASDVAARGLDIPAVSHVFNYDLPSHAEDYVHRIGRTGRAGRLGTAISIATPSDEKYLSAIENLVKKTLPRSDLPEGFTLAERDRPQREDRRDDRREDRRGGRDKRRRDRQDEAGDTARAEAAPIPRAPREERTEPARTEHPVRAERNEPRREPARDDRNDSRRDDRRDGRRGRGRDDHRGPAIVGMGDHVPEFMLVELRPAGPMTFDTDSDDTVETPAAVAESVQSEAPAKSRRSRSRGRGRDQAARDSAAQTDTAQVQDAVTEAAPVADPAAAEPAPVETISAPAEVAEAATPAKRTRRKKTDTADATAQPAETTEEVAPKPRRSRKPAAETVAAAEGDAAPAEKPKRVRRKKADTVEAASAEATEAPVKRTRRKKADAPAAAVDGNVPAEG